MNVSTSQSNATAAPGTILILSSQDLQTVMRFDDYVDAVAEAFRMLAEGRCESPVPLQVSVTNGTFHAKAASLPVGPGYVAVKVNGNFPDNRSRHELPTIQGVVFLADANGGSDYAVTSDGGDYTVHVVVGVDVDSRIYLLDLWRGQSSPEVWVREWCRLVREWCPLDWAEEKGQITAGVGPFIEQEARRNKAFVNREQFPTRGDKSVRAQSIRGRMSIDGLYVPTSAPWFADFRAELLSFPAGRHDDQVDALGLVDKLLDVMIDGRHPPKRELKQPKSGYSTYEFENESWKVY